jgi:uncharacterized membrane-anchored protein YhcB (DUF1043 family)
MDGMGMLFKSMGFDVEKAQKDFEQLKTAVTGTLAEISKRLTTLEAQQKQIIELLQETNPVLLADLEQHTTLLQELTAWKRKTEYRPGQVMNQPAPPQPQPHQPQPVQTEHTPQP